MLQLLRASLRAQSAIVLWSRSNDAKVRIREAETCSDHLRGRTFGVHEGVLGTLRFGSDIAIVNNASAQPGLFPWYAEGCGPGAAVAVPLLRDGIPLGFLIVDRAQGDPPFDDVDAIAVRAAAEQIALSIHMEFLVLEAATAHRDIAVLDAAASRLNRALTISDVFTEARGILGEFVDFDFLALTENDVETGEQRVLHSEGFGSDGLTGHTFSAGEDLASLAARCNECLPYNGRLARPGVPVFGDRSVPGARSLLVFPLSMAQGVIGSLCIASGGDDGFSGAPRNLLGILVHHVAAALSNALAYSRMVQMATTDGMTGLTNHRTFKERGAEALARAKRSGRPLSLIISDIDHVKGVNDTHGHAMGDTVIKRVATLLTVSARDVDIVARYGGEEFAILLEECDAEAASQIAERIREAIKETEFDGAEGPFGVTLSLGVCEYQTGNLSELIDEADKALYIAKRGGRDRVVQAGRPQVAAA
jgi:diguanylate cyclase (GGDEF)-like protein